MYGLLWAEASTALRQRRGREVGLVAQGEDPGLLILSRHHEERGGAPAVLGQLGHRPGPAAWPAQVLLQRLDVEERLEEIEEAGQRKRLPVRSS